MWFIKIAVMRDVGSCLDASFGHILQTKGFLPTLAGISATGLRKFCEFSAFRVLWCVVYGLVIWF